MKLELLTKREMEVCEGIVDEIYDRFITSLYVKNKRMARYIAERLKVKVEEMGEEK